MSTLRSPKSAAAQGAFPVQYCVTIPSLFRDAANRTEMLHSKREKITALDTQVEGIYRELSMQMNRLTAVQVA